jgi:hypothetical protein
MTSPQPRRTTVPRFLVPLILALTGCGLAAGDRAATTTTAPTALALTDSVSVLGALAREPMVIEHPGGALFVTGYGLPGPKLWKSSDHGASWQRVDVGTERDGAVGNSDVDLALDPDGTLYFVTMGYDRKVHEGTHVAIGVSRDVGTSWTWTRLDNTRFDDRPWVDVAPDGTAHVIWNDGKGVAHVASGDGGRTWTARPRVHDHGGSSHLTVGPHGEVAVRVVPLSASGNTFDDGVDLIAVSTDGGTSWVKHPAPGERRWGFPLGAPASLPRWVEPLAWDSTGGLWSLWSEGTRLRLARSSDQGGTWRVWTVLDDVAPLYYPYLVARGAGTLAASWFSGTGDSLQANVALLEAQPDGSAPHVLRAPPFVPDSWRSWDKGADPPVRDTDGEYLALTFLRDGGIAAVSPVQDPEAGRFGFTWRRFVAR